MTDRKVPLCAILKLAPWQEEALFVPPGQEGLSEDDVPTTEEFTEEELEEILLEEDSITEERDVESTSIWRGGWTD